MIRKLARFFRFAAEAERLLLAYQAWGYSEEEVLERWRNDLENSADARLPSVRKVLWSEADLRPTLDVRSRQT